MTQSGTQSVTMPDGHTVVFPAGMPSDQVRAHLALTPAFAKYFPAHFVAAAPAILAWRGEPAYAHLLPGLRAQQAQKIQGLEQIDKAAHQSTYWIPWRPHDAPSSPKVKAEATARIKQLQNVHHSGGLIDDVSTFVEGYGNWLLKQTPFDFSRQKSDGASPVDIEMNRQLRNMSIPQQAHVLSGEYALDALIPQVMRADARAGGISAGAANFAKKVVTPTNAILLGAGALAKTFVASMNAYKAAETVEAIRAVQAGADTAEVAAHLRNAANAAKSIKYLGLAQLGVSGYFTATAGVGTVEAAMDTALRNKDNKQYWTQVALSGAATLLGAKFTRDMYDGVQLASEVAATHGKAVENAGRAVDEYGPSRARSNVTIVPPKMLPPATSAPVDTSTPVDTPAPTPAPMPEPTGSEPVDVSVPVHSGTPVARDETKFVGYRAVTLSKPRYGYGSKQFVPTFDSQVDKAAYIVANKGQSAKHPEIVAFLRAHGFSDEAIAAHGTMVKAALKRLAKDAPSGATIHVPSVGLASPAVPTAAPAPPAPAAPQTQAPFSLAQPGEDNAVQESGAAGVLQRQSEEVGSGRSGRGGVEPGEQGQAAAALRPVAPRAEGVDGDTQPTQETAGIKPAPAGIIQNTDFYNMNPQDIIADPGRFQFRRESRALTADKFNPDAAGVLDVWRDPNDGKTYVVNGHHRLHLAKRLGAKSVVVHFIDAANEQDAKRHGALKNIMEGQAEPMDVARTFRDGGMTDVHLKEMGMSLTGRRTVVRDGRALARLSGLLWEHVGTGVMPESTGIAIGQNAENEAEQHAIYKVMQESAKHGRVIKDDVIPQLAISVRNAPNMRITPDMNNGQLGFGDTEEGAGEGTFTENELMAVQQAEIATKVRKELSRPERDLRGVARENIMGIVAKYDTAENKIDLRANQRIVNDSIEQVAQFDAARAANETGLTNILNDAVVKESKGDHNAAEAAIEQVREYLARRAEKYRVSKPDGEAGGDGRGGAESTIPSLLRDGETTPAEQDPQTEAGPKKQDDSGLGQLNFGVDPVYAVRQATDIVRAAQQLQSRVGARTAGIAQVMRNLVVEGGSHLRALNRLSYEAATTAAGSFARAQREYQDRVPVVLREILDEDDVKRFGLYGVLDRALSERDSLYDEITKLGNSLRQFIAENNAKLAAAASQFEKDYLTEQIDEAKFNADVLMKKLLKSIEQNVMTRNEAALAGSPADIVTVDDPVTGHPISERDIQRFFSQQDIEEALIAHKEHVEPYMREQFEVEERIADGDLGKYSGGFFPAMPLSEEDGLVGGGGGSGGRFAPMMEMHRVPGDYHFSGTAYSYVSDYGTMIRKRFESGTAAKSVHDMIATLLKQGVMQPVKLPGINKTDEAATRRARAETALFGTDAPEPEEESRRLQDMTPNPKVRKTSIMRQGREVQHTEVLSNGVWKQAVSFSIQGHVGRFSRIGRKFAELPTDVVLPTDVYGELLPIFERQTMSELDDSASRIVSRHIMWQLLGVSEISSHFRALGSRLASVVPAVRTRNNWVNKRQTGALHYATSLIHSARLSGISIHDAIAAKTMKRQMVMSDEDRMEASKIAASAGALPSNFGLQIYPEDTALQRLSKLFGRMLYGERGALSTFHTAIYLCVKRAGLLGNPEAVDMMHDMMRQGNTHVRFLQSGIASGPKIFRLINTYSQTGVRNRAAAFAGGMNRYMERLAGTLFLVAFLTMLRDPRHRAPYKIPGSAPGDIYLEHDDGKEVWINIVGSGDRAMGYGLTPVTSAIRSYAENDPPGTVMRHIGAAIFNYAIATQTGGPIPAAMIWATGIQPFATLNNKNQFALMPTPDAALSYDSPNRLFHLAESVAPMIRIAGEEDWPSQRMHSVVLNYIQKALRATGEGQMKYSNPGHTNYLAAKRRFAQQRAEVKASRAP